MKEIESSSFELSEITSDYLEQRNVDSIIELALRNTLLTLHKSYKDKNKCDSDEIELFEKALRDIAFDLKDGGVNPGLYKYLIVHKPDITQDIYAKKYRNMLEYLFKILKQNIAEKIK
ncbi:MAG: hypothetical protein ACUVT3_12590 [Ignavibacterium sp.]